MWCSSQLIARPLPQSPYRQSRLPAGETQRPLPCQAKMRFSVAFAGASELPVDGFLANLLHPSQRSQILAFPECPPLKRLARKRSSPQLNPGLRVGQQTIHEWIQARPTRKRTLRLRPCHFDPTRHQTLPGSPVPRRASLRAEHLHRRLRTGPEENGVDPNRHEPLLQTHAQALH